MNTGLRKYSLRIKLIKELISNGQGIIIEGTKLIKE